MIKPGNIPSVSLNDILDIITEDDILYHYFGISKLPCLINSPLRKDEKPSFSIFKSNNLRKNQAQISNLSKKRSIISN